MTHDEFIAQAMERARLSGAIANLDMKINPLIPIAREIFKVLGEKEDGIRVVRCCGMIYTVPEFLAGHLWRVKANSVEDFMRHQVEDALARAL